MRKYLTLIILIMCTVMCVACGKDPSITYARTSIQANIGTNYVISASDIKINNSKSSYEIISLDEDIAEVEGLVIIPKSLGETTLRFQLIDNNSIHFDVKLTVVRIIYAQSVSVENEIVYINFNTSNEMYNKITFNDECNEVPEVRFDSNIISYDYLTGKIIGISLGETEVVVLFRDCNVSFRVYVIDKIFTKSLVVGDTTIVEGYEGKFNYSVFPSNANTYTFFTTSEYGDKIKVFADGSYIALGVGSVVVCCEYFSSAGGLATLKSFNVNIIDEIDSFEFEVVNSNGQRQDYILLEEKYKLRIFIDNTLDTEYIKISENITLLSPIQTFDEGFVVEFYFKNLGNNAISINIQFDENSIALSSSNNYFVNGLKDIKIMAKLGIYIQEPNSQDGKYYLSLSNDNTTNAVVFYPMINDCFVNMELKVYDITNGSQVSINNHFIATDIGEYIIQFVIMGVVVEQCTIVVTA